MLTPYPDTHTKIFLQKGILIQNLFKPFLFCLLYKSHPQDAIFYGRFCNEQGYQETIRVICSIHRHPAADADKA